MLKYYKVASSRLLFTIVTAAVCLPLAGCLNAGDPWGEGSMAYTSDEMYPIAQKKPCGQEWPDLANDESNHLSPNHGCALHANIAAMVADPSVLRKPRKFSATPADPAVGALNYYEFATAGTTASNFGGAGSGSASGTGAKP
jgi:Pilus biogenesis CpaD protein (pilus_cpaD)